MSDYYKSLISDDEVIKELIKESKRREGKLPTEATRLKPNLNFFQRTVNNLISNNTRIDKTQDTFKTEFLKDCNLEKPETSDSSPKYPLKKTSIDYAFERNMVLKTKINFVTSSEAFNNSYTRAKKKIEIKKINFINGVRNNFITATGSNISGKTGTGQNLKQRLDDSFSDSEDSKLRNDLIVMLSDEERKTTCKSISTKHETSDLKNKNGKFTKSNIICISSEDDSVEIISSDSEEKEIKNKDKIRTKKRKKNNSKDKLDAECGKKSKRKKHKKKKK